MKKFFLASVALLAICGQGHANWDTRFKLPAVQLPAEMIGLWCMEDSENPHKVARYNRIEDEEKCTGGNPPLHVRPDGWEEMWDNCPFTTIEKSPGGYTIYSRCEMLAEGDGHGIGQYFTVHMEYRLEDGQLVVTELPET
jgi:hypothetical protein